MWDLLGKLRNEPVYAMLGGKVWERLPVYMTSSNPLNAKNMGFVGGKIPCPYGPADGDIGLRKNVEFFKGWREKVGPEFPLMLDCYMSLSVPYAIKLAKALQPYDLKWMEEFLPPDDYDGYVTVKDALKDKAEDVRVTTRLVDSPACLVVQEDGMSTQLARMLKQAGQKAPEVKPVLEVNPEHPLVKKLEASAHFEDLANILFDQALLAEGGLPADPAAYVRRVNALLV